MFTGSLYVLPCLVQFIQKFLVMHIFQTETDQNYAIISFGIPNQIWKHKDTKPVQFLVTGFILNVNNGELLLNFSTEANQITLVLNIYFTRDFEYLIEKTSDSLKLHGIKVKYIMDCHDSSLIFNCRFHSLSLDCLQFYDLQILTLFLHFNVEISSYAH